MSSLTIEVDTSSEIGRIILPLLESNFFTGLTSRAEGLISEGWCHKLRLESSIEDLQVAANLLCESRPDNQYVSILAKAISDHAEKSGEFRYVLQDDNLRQLRSDEDVNDYFERVMVIAGQ